MLVVVLYACAGKVPLAKRNCALASAVSITRASEETLEEDTRRGNATGVVLGCGHSRLMASTSARPLRVTRCAIVTTANRVSSPIFAAAVALVYK